MTATAPLRIPPPTFQLLGAEMLEAADGRARVRFVPGHDTTNPAGLVGIGRTRGVFCRNQKYGLEVSLVGECSENESGAWTGEYRAGKGFENAQPMGRYGKAGNQWGRDVSGRGWFSVRRRDRCELDARLRERAACVVEPAAGYG